MSNLQTYYHFKLDFQKVEQHTWGKWLIHSTKRRKDNRLQILKLPYNTYFKMNYITLLCDCRSLFYSLLCLVLVEFPIFFRDSSPVLVQSLQPLK